LNFLIDHQLPPALARFLESHGHSAQHVRELGLKEADDLVIWHHAAVHDMAVISKDQDFYFIATLPGATGKLIWVRIGNCRKQTLLETFKAKLSQIVEVLETDSRIVEIH
jgi:predicted nuclease of predicted toxin-antitoxin system